MSPPTTDLARACRLEANETAAYRSLFQVGRSLFGTDAFRCEERRGAVAFLCPSVTLPGAFNRVLMLGLQHPVEASQMADLVALYDEAGCGLAIELPQPVRNDDVNGLLKAHRIRRGSTAAVVAHWAPAMSPSPVRNPVTEVSVASGDDRDRVAAICAEVFAMPSNIREVLAALCREPGWIPWIVRHEGEPAGAGLTRIDKQEAWFGWAATLPPYRGRGLKGALDAAHLHACGAVNCAFVSAETAAGSIEKPDHSLKSFIRHGFEVAYLRDTLFQAVQRPRQATSASPASGPADRP